MVVDDAVGKPVLDRRGGPAPWSWRQTRGAGVPGRGNGIGLGEKGDLPASESDPINACRQAIEAGEQESAEISDVAIDGEVATATVSLETNSLGIERLTLGLVDMRGWKVDSLRSLRLDRSRFLDGLRREQAGPQATVKQRRYFRCELGWVAQNVSTRELERAIRTQDGSYYLGSFDRCAARYRILVAWITGAKSASTPEQRACVSRTFDRLVERRDLHDLYEASATGKSAPASVEAKMSTVIAACR